MVKRTPEDKPAFTFTGSLLNDCPEFMAKIVTARKAFVTRIKACYRCLDWTHTTDNCFRTDWACHVGGCDAFHSKYLHEPPTQQVSPEADIIEVTNGALTSTEDPEQHPDPPRRPGPVLEHPSVLLEIQHIPAGRPDSSETFQSRLMFDRGSMLSLVSHKWATKAGLPSRAQTIFLSVLGRDFTKIETREYTVQIIDKHGNIHSAQVLGVPKVCPIVGPSNLAFLAHLFPEADPSVFTRPEGEVDILIGMDHRKILPDGGRFVDELCLAKSQFGKGHILTGAHPRVKGPPMTFSSMALQLRGGSRDPPRVGVSCFADVLLPQWPPSM